MLWNKNSKFQSRIGLKLFLRLARATGEGTTKFGIFLRWFGTFSNLIEFSRDVTYQLEAELRLPKMIRNGAKLFHRVLCALGTNFGSR